MYRWEITRAALEQRVFAIIRSDSYERAASTADTLLGAGITSLEISLTTPYALDVVSTLRRETGEDTVIGAGTVLDAATARSAIDAGARFLVSPAPGRRSDPYRTPLRRAGLPRRRHPHRDGARDGTRRRRPQVLPGLRVTARAG